jgi:hypothetical protein
VRPDEQGEKLLMIQVANLRLKLLFKPIAVGFITSHRPTREELKGVPTPVVATTVAIGDLDQVENLLFQPLPRNTRRTGMGWNLLMPG